MPPDEIEEGSPRHEKTVEKAEANANLQTLLKNKAEKTLAFGGFGGTQRIRGRGVEDASR